MGGINDGGRQWRLVASVAQRPAGHADPDAPRRIQAFRQGLQELGWTDGRNVLVEYRFGAADASRIAMQVAELVALKPDVIVGNNPGCGHTGAWPCVKHRTP